MAITAFDSGDSFGVIIDNINVVSTNVGNADEYLGTAGNDAVTEFNNIRASIQNFNDSAEIVNIIKEAYATVNNNDGNIDFSDGVFTLTGITESEIIAKINGSITMSMNAQGVLSLVDSSIDADDLPDDFITSSKFDSVVTTIIKASDDTTLKTIRTMGS